jgi:hypothetical protein
MKILISGNKSVVFDKLNNFLLSRNHDVYYEADKKNAMERVLSSEVDILVCESHFIEYIFSNTDKDFVGLEK